MSPFFFPNHQLKKPSRTTKCIGRTRTSVIDFKNSCSPMRPAFALEPVNKYAKNRTPLPNLYFSKVIQFLGLLSPSLCTSDYWWKIILGNTPQRATIIYPVVSVNNACIVSSRLRNDYLKILTIQKECKCREALVIEFWPLFFDFIRWEAS